MTRPSPSRVPRRAAAVMLAALLATTAAPAVAADTDVEPTPAAESAAPGGDAPAATPPADEAPADEAPVEDVPAEDAPADEAPAEEASSEEAPAAKAPNSIDMALQNVAALAIVPGEASTITVNSAGVAADASIGDGVCDTGATVGDPAVPECTLRAALLEANAVELDGTAPSSITIDFTDLGLVSYGPGDVAGSLMDDALVGQLWGNMGLGSQFAIDSAVPVTIDFANLDGIEHAADSPYALFDVRSNNVTLENAGSMRAGEVAIAIRSSNVVVDDVVISDEATPNLEVGIGLLDGASNVTVTDSSIISSAFVGVLVDLNAAVSNITFDNLLSRGHSNAHVDFEDGASVNGFEITSSQVGLPAEAAPSPHVYINPNVDVTGLQLRDSRFESPNQIGVGIYGGGVTMTDTVLDGAVFNGTGIAFQDGGAATVNGLDITNSTFAGVLNRAINLEATRASDVQIAQNLFSDMRGAPAATIYVGYVSDDSVIGDNRFIQGEGDGIDRNRWAVYFAPRDAAAGVDTGWSIVDNEIDGYQGDSNGPLTMVGTGDTFVARNTFGPNTTGTTLTESENGTRFFVYNNGSANGPIQTWRPTASAVGGGELTVRVAPVDPPLPRNVAPTGPVDLDVYWTATDNAEVYVGTIEDVTGPVTESFDFDGEAGFVRVQTHDADGRSSQYSASVQAPEDEIAPDPVVVEDAPQDGPVTGTGEAGATVVVYDEDGNVVGVGEVQEDGTFSVELDEPLECDVEYSAVQFDLAGNASDPVPFAADDCEAGGGDGDGGDNGAGGAGGDQAGDGASLPDTGSPAGLLALLVAGLAALATGVVTARRRSA